MVNEEALNMNYSNDSEDLDVVHLESGDANLTQYQNSRRTIRSTLFADGMIQVQGRDTQPSANTLFTKPEVREIIHNEVSYQQLRLEIQDQNRNDQTEDDGQQQHKLSLLPKDTYSLMMVSKRNTSPWMVGLCTYIFQMLLLLFLSVEITIDGGNVLSHFPLKVDPKVSCVQFIVLLVLFFLTKRDLVVAARNLIRMSKNNFDNLVDNVSRLVELEDMVKARARFVYASVMKLTMAILTVTVSVLLTIKGNTTFDLLKDFAFLFIVSQLDYLLYKLFVFINGYFGLESLRESEEITRKISIRMTTSNRVFRWDAIIVSVVYGSALISWIAILVLQLNGTIAREKGCNVNYALLGNGRCDGGAFNTLECEWDAGDCEVFKNEYPNCPAIDPWKIRNEVCDGGDYNTEVCGWDGGDCKEFNTKHPDCTKIDFPEWIGNGRCDKGEYDTSECGWDGGDCVSIENYPGCRVSKAGLIGNGSCNPGEEYNTEECAWDGGDCEEFNENYPDCTVSFPDRIGDGECDGGEYNTGECGWDGLDCFQFNFPTCTVDNQDWIGNGRCDKGEYDTSECGWDGGDCVSLENYPGCRVYEPGWVGNGSCNPPANREECGWDGGDCAVPGYPDCHVGMPYSIGNGSCTKWGNYNSEECGWDGGDCNEVPGYPGCLVAFPSFVGNGICNSEEYNNEECGWDGGDCDDFNKNYPGCRADPPAVGDGVCDSWRGFFFNTTECGFDGGDCL